MNPYTHPVCAALVLTFAVSVASAQTAPAEGGAQPTPATKPAEKKPATKPAPAKADQPTPAQTPAVAGQAKPAQATAASATTAVAVPVVPGAVTPPSDYLIGPDDVLSIVYWKDKDMTSDVVVRPDGMISLPLLNEVAASGLTPAQLRDRLMTESQKLMEDPNVTIVVKQINSRKVYVTGQVGKIGPHSLTGPMTVLQLLSTVGGIGEFANSKNIIILRTENGRQVSHRFNYKEVVEGKKLAQNIELKPGDTIVVP
jgi:polysaccharide biosynthesis/export protein